MRIRIVTPEGAAPRTGNVVTSDRWRRLLRGLGHRVELASTSGPCDVLVALHARKSAAAVASFRWRTPVVVALTGTDLYGDTPSHPDVRRSLDLATRVVVLQPAALEALPAGVQEKTRVIYQSAVVRRGRRSPRAFEVAVVAHLREIKDPFRAEEAVRELPETSRIRVRHVGGGIHDPALEAEARARTAANPRYAWLGERGELETRRVIADSQVLVLSSRAEGGANVISEAVVAGVPVLASRIPGTIGLLGEDYPGLFEVGDTAGLRALLLRAESDPAFLRQLEASGRRLRPLFSPARERKAWKELLAELQPRSSR